MLMDRAPQTVILLITDSMFREGLQLLLEDMHFVVSSSDSYLDIEQLLHRHTVAPALLIFSQILSNGKPAVDFVIELRNRFNRCIPAILLRSENTVHLSLVDSTDIDTDLVVLPEQIKPKALRQVINELFTDRQMA